VTEKLILGYRTLHSYFSLVIDPRHHSRRCRWHEWDQICQRCTLIVVSNENCRIS